MIQITQDELNAFNIISAQYTNTKAQLEATVAAQNAIIALLELKYNAVFNKDTGTFESKSGEAEK